MFCLQETWNIVHESWGELLYFLMHSVEAWHLEESFHCYWSEKTFFKMYNDVRISNYIFFIFGLTVPLFITKKVANLFYWQRYTIEWRDTITQHSAGCLVHLIKLLHWSDFTHNLLLFIISLHIYTRHNA